MDPSRDRRRFLATLGAGSLAFAAGCVDDFPTDIDTGTGDDAEPPENDDPEIDDADDEEPDPPRPTEHEWSTEADWDDARGRTGVVSGDLGGRDPDTLALGYDPAVEPVSEFDAFWPLEEDDSDTETFADALGDAVLVHDPEEWGFSDDIDPSATGLFGGTSVEFDGDDALVNEDVPIDPAEDWTMGLWVWFDGPEEQPHSNAMMLESVDGDQPDEDDEALGLMPNIDPPAFKIGSVNNTPGYGTEIDREEWRFHVLRYRASDNSAEGYLDGEFEYSVEPEDGEEWIPDLHDVALGRRRVGDSGKIFNGRLDVPWMTQGLVSEEDIRRLYETAFEGRLVTDRRLAAGEATGLEVTAEVPDGTAVSVTVHQDASGDGESDVSQAVDIEEETESYGLDGFEEADDGAYWVEVALETEDPEVTPRVESIVVEFDADGD
jgi:hypothetical protein